MHILVDSILEDEEPPYVASGIDDHVEDRCKRCGVMKSHHSQSCNQPSLWRHDMEKEIKDNSNFQRK